MNAQVDPSVTEAVDEDAPDVDIPVLLIGYDPSWIEGTFTPRPPAPAPLPPVRSIAQIKKWRKYGHLVAKAYDRETQLWLCVNKDGVECYRSVEELHALRSSWL
jgi:hypothetical protein